jgi:hypothetical protein
MDTLQTPPLTMCVSKATLAASGAATTFTTTGATLYCIKGKAYSTAAAAGTATPTSDAATGLAFVPITINNGAMAVWCYDGSATAVAGIKVVLGPMAPLDASGNFSVNAPGMPVIPDTLCPFGYTIHKNGATGSNWTFGTSQWNATGMTTSTPQDLMTMPGRPQVA